MLNVVRDAHFENFNEVCIYCFFFLQWLLYTNFEYFKNTALKQLFKAVCSKLYNCSKNREKLKIFLSGWSVIIVFIP